MQNCDTVRTLVCAAAFVLCAAPFCRAGDGGGLNVITQGMSRAEVVGVMGRPAGAMRMGSKDILMFKDGEVELSGDRVVSVKHAGGASAKPAAGPARAPAPAVHVKSDPVRDAVPSVPAGARIVTLPSTTAHEILKLEVRFGANSKDEAVLNDLLIKAKKSLPVAAPNAEGAAAKHCLEAIQALLKKEGFTYRETAFLFEALRTKKSDCDTTTLLYCAIGETMGYPIGAVVLPRHAFVRWVLPHGNVVNWETTEKGPNASFSDGSYYDWLLKGMTGEGCNLKTLTREQLPAIHHYMAGLAFTFVNRLDEALKEHDAALKLDKNWYLSRLEKSGVHLAKESYAEGANESLKAMEYLPVDELGQLTAAALGLAIIAKQEADVDRKQLGRIVRGFMRRDSDSAGYVMLNALDAYLADRGSSAMADLDGVCGKWPTNFVPFLCRAAIRDRSGDTGGAARDGQEVLKLMKASGVTRPVRHLQPPAKREE